jgi:perosamine synthetase
VLSPKELALEDMGELAQIIPGPDPKLNVQMSTIPEFEGLRRTYIPVCEPILGGREMEYVTRCLQTNWISSAGQYIRDFESAFAAKCGAGYGVACANGTVALHLALATLGLEPGDEVILPAFTMIATINAVTYCGATPVLVDSEPGTWNMDVEQVAARISDRTRAVIAVHTYGHPVDMDALNAIAEKRGVVVIEDAAEAHGARYKGRPTGSLGLAASFSFYGNKIITTGEGGMVTTNDERVARLAWNLRDHAFSSERHFWHKFIGFNYRMTNMQAAVGLAQTERLDDYVAMRQGNAQRYTERLSRVPGMTTPPQADWAENVFWMYGVLVDPREYGKSRDQLRAYLAERGIETRTFFIPMHCQPVYWDQFLGQRFPVAEDLCRRGFYLPSASSLTAAEVDYVCSVIASGYTG